MHGDLYAHNTLIDKDANSLMGDFGAASFYDKTSLIFFHSLGLSPLLLPNPFSLRIHLNGVMFFQNIVRY